jgi:hypothetical protein
MLEQLKKTLTEKIEKNSVKSELSYVDKEGNTQTEIVYLKKSLIPILGDWHRVYPPVNEDGSWNKVNLIFGGKRNLIKLIIVLALAGLFFLAFKEIGSNYETLANLPCVKNCLFNINNATI